MPIMSDTGKKKAPKAATKKAAAPCCTPAQATEASIDYPKEGESVLPGHYAVRISAKTAGSVEVSINNGPWHTCRTADGYHWYDWTPSTPGRATISARCKSSNGCAKTPTTRTCQVKKPTCN